MPTTSQPSITTAVPDRADRRHAAIFVAVTTASVVAIAPFAHQPLPRSPAFIPAYESALAIISLVTAAVLFSQFATLRRRSLLLLAAGYLLNTLLIAAHLLSFPGVFADVGAFGDSQTTAWLYIFWHATFPVLIACYAVLAGGRRDVVDGRRSAARLAWRIVFVVCAAAAAFIVVSAHAERLLPIVVVAGDYRRLTRLGIAPGLLVIVASAIALMWRHRKRSVLDLWLIALLWLWLCDGTLSAFVSSARYQLGWYSGRVFGLVASSVLLTAFLFELDKLYARLARAVADAEARNEELVRSRGELVRAQRLEALGQLTGGLAHDFNNLLTAIGGGLEMIARRPQDAERVTRLAGNASKTVERGAQLIRRLMSFARKQSLRPEVVDVRAALVELETLAARVLRPADRLDLALDDDVGAVRVDLAELEAALLNLVTNARDAMPDGGAVVVSARRDDDVVEIAVGDTGEGMSTDVQARVFEPFFTTKALGLGTGLGLSQVHGFVHGAGGTIDVESAPGRGTTFRIRLPREASAAPAAPVVVAAAPGDVAHGRSVLVVEDDDDVRTSTRDRVEELGYRVTTASSGDEAFELLAGGLLVHVVFSDILMPGRLDGVALVAEARPLCPAAGWLLTSGYTGGALDRLALPPDVLFLPKPFGQAELSEKLEAAAVANLTRAAA